jgi:hydroxyproline transporter system substrate-binding protein
LIEIALPWSQRSLGVLTIRRHWFLRGMEGTAVKKAFSIVFALLGTIGAASARADMLDNIINAGTLRCAIMLDFAPMGFRDAQQKPAGFDVDYCDDLAKALGVKAEYVETPLPDRIPALMSGRADVAVASASDTLERAKTIGFTIPYSPSLQ